MADSPRKFDCVVVGGGIAGMEAAITLGDMGFTSLLVEKEASIGGKMILLSKVFPTLDCSSCISTPKMAATQNHPKVTMATWSRVDEIERLPSGRFRIKVTKRPTYVRQDRCTGCGQCERVCTVARPNQFEDGLIARRAIYIPFPQAVPKKAVIERRGLSPCSRACPAGIKAHGCLALIRAGRLEAAVKRHLEDAPLPRTLCALCEGWCEARCTQGRGSGRPVAIRSLKAVAAEAAPETSLEYPNPVDGPKVAVVGAGAAGLACAHHLARMGLAVTVFDKEPVAGGRIRTLMEAMGLPAPLLEKDLSEMEAAGVRFVLGQPVDKPEELLDSGFEALFLATGACARPQGAASIDQDTLALSENGLFAGGECITGPAPVAHAAGMGKRGAFSIYRYLTGRNPENIEMEPRVGAPSSSEPPPSSPGPTRLTAPQVAEEAARCLDCAGCSLCHQCKEACPADAIDFTMEPETLEIEAGAVVLATGFDLFDPSHLELTGYSEYPNVITAMQMDRLLAPTRPYNALLRPSDGKVPGNIAIVLCTGSRDDSSGNPWCSRICCMYSLKQAQLIMGALPIAEITIYYIDIRAFGKGYEEFFQQAKGMGVNLVKGKVARIDQGPNHDLYLYYEDMEGRGSARRARHDLVILAVGALANPALRRSIKGEDLQLDRLRFFQEVEEIGEPCRTNIPGVFVAGAASGPKDIPDSVLHASAAAAQVAVHLKGLEGKGHV